MNLQAIKDAIEQGLNVHWDNDSYVVVKDTKGQFLIKHQSGHCIGLTWADDVTLNGKEEQFYIK